MQSIEVEPIESEVPVSPLDCRHWKAGTWGKVIFLLCVIATVAGLLIGYRDEIGDFLGNGGTLQHFVEDIGYWGALLYVGVYILCTIAFVPGTVLSVGAGFIFHDGTVGSLFYAWVIVILGYTIGSSLAFVLGRTILRDWVTQKLSYYDNFVLISNAIKTKGFLVTLLCRLSPVVPYNLCNYALGVTEVKFLHSVSASFMGMLPGSFLLVYTGWAAKDAIVSGVESKGTGNDVDTARSVLVFGVGPVVTVVLVVVVTVAARRTMARTLAEEEQRRADAPEEREEEAGVTSEIENDGVRDDAPVSDSTFSGSYDFA